MDGQVCFRFNRWFAVNGLTGDVEHTAEGGRTDRYSNRLTGTRHGLTAAKTIGRRHRDRSHNAGAQVLLNFQDKRLHLLSINLQGSQELWYIAVKFDIDHGADHLMNRS